MTIREGEEVNAKGLETGWNMTGDAKEHPAISELLALEHFTVYALDGKTGGVLWQHDGSEGTGGERLAASLPLHAYTYDHVDLSRQLKAGHSSTTGSTTHTHIIVKTYY